MEIYIIRHGRTDWNSIRRIQGSTDIELNENGRKMAIETQKGMQGIHLDAIYSSPLKRAYETAQIISEGRGLQIIKDDRLKELNFGDLEGEDYMNITDADYNPQYGHFFSRPELYQTPPNGESLEELCQRAAEFMADLLRNHYDKERILVTGHGTVNKALLRYVKHSELKDLWQGKLQKNCAITVVSYEKGYGSVMEENKIFY